MSAKACPVCSSMEPDTIDRLLVWGRSPRWIAPKFGHPRAAVVRHEKTCLTRERRVQVERELMETVDDVVTADVEASEADGGGGPT